MAGAGSNGGSAPQQSLPRWFSGYSAFVAAVNRCFAAIGIALIAALMLTILQDVIARYVLRAGLAWGVDFSRYMLTYLFFFGMGPALASGHHVAVDLFESLVPHAFRRWLPLLSSLLCLIFGAILFRFLARATWHAYSTDALTATMVAIPVWWVYVAGPLGALQFVLTSVLHMLRAWRRERLFDAVGPTPDAAA